MDRRSVAIFALFAFICVASATWCPSNEEYSACRAHCPGNCRYQAKSCRSFCVSGCKCKQGYVRGPRGDCIKLEDCPSKEIPKEYICPTNELFNTCVAHCQGNCTTSEDSIPCPRTCVSGCICEEGYTRGPNGKCIPEHQCPRQIDEGSGMEVTRGVEEDSKSVREENASEEVQEIGAQDGVMRRDGSAEYDVADALLELFSSLEGRKKRANRDWLDAEMKKRAFPFRRKRDWKSSLGDNYRQADLQTGRKKRDWKSSLGDNYRQGDLQTGRKKRGSWSRDESGMTYYRD